MSHRLFSSKNKVACDKIKKIGRDTTFSKPLDLHFGCNQIPPSMHTYSYLLNTLMDVTAVCIFLSQSITVLPSYSLKKAKCKHPLPKSIICFLAATRSPPCVLSFSSSPPGLRLDLIAV
ncbi:hypothetical protein VIGAN_UM003400 [Vigna angularis var. angularis]|uniref:Uncharacterized protein n=1 Tax=Vigna angularis var. angularis TaxID=157739 RepID=A0A0S3TDL9_PHAAN|nr:hypothetical protein VIGAN_UM003400 [Vigna angularis var. angularis]